MLFQACTRHEVNRAPGRQGNRPINTNVERPNLESHRHARLKAGTQLCLRPRMALLAANFAASLTSNA